MLKVLVAGIVSFGLLAGCTSQQERKEQAAQQRATQLGTFRHLCENDYGIKDNTPAMSTCMQDMDKDASRRASEANQALIRMGSSYSCESQGGVFNHQTGACQWQQQQQPASGRIYDRNNNQVGTFGY